MVIVRNRTIHLRHLLERPSKVNNTMLERLTPRRLYLDTISSLMFLSRLPVARIGPAELPDFPKSSQTFLIAGFIIALPGALVLYSSVLLGMPHLIAAALGVIVSVMTTGGLHEDGLADVADGFWGGHTKERKLEIMRDSSVGSYGSMAIIVSIGLRVFCIAALLDRFTLSETMIALVLISGFSRSTMLYPWYVLPNARTACSEERTKPKEKPKRDLSSGFGQPGLDAMGASLIISVPCQIAFIYLVGIVPGLISLLFAYLLMYGMTELIRKHLGGHTGDTLGAVQQVVTLGMLLGLLIKFGS